MKKTGFFSSLTALVLFAVALSSSISLKNDCQRCDSAVVMKGVVAVKSTPSADGNDLFILHEGTRLEITDNVGDWSEVKIDDGRQGWISRFDIEVI